MALFGILIYQVNELPAVGCATFIAELERGASGGGGDTEQEIALGSEFPSVATACPDLGLGSFQVNAEKQLA